MTRLIEKIGTVTYIGEAKLNSSKLTSAKIWVIKRITEVSSDETKIESVKGIDNVIYSVWDDKATLEYK